MTVAELIESLQEIADTLEAEGLDPGTVEVRMAQQPRWAMEYAIASVVDSADAEDDDDGDEDDDREEGEDAERVVYITEGSHIGYLRDGIL